MKFSRSLSLILFLLVAFVPLYAKDEWVQVKSKNFLLIGNASEKDIRKVATRLEQFRETFRLLFANMNLTSPIQTNVVVFKNDAAYKNFKPKRADGSIDTEVAGFFQPGEDVNYITLSTEGDESQTFATIFHEYVHFIVNTNFGKSEVPPWFNEGLAEYYSTFTIEDDIRVKLGIPRSTHLMLLQQSPLMPLDKLFRVSNFELLQTGGHSRSIFYAESWAIVHYLIQSGKTDGMNNFLAAVMKGEQAEKAFQEAFQIGYAAMEETLRQYVSQGKYNYHEVMFKNKLTFNADMQASPLDEADSDAYLGDLLYHNNREDDAEPFLLAALKLRPDSSMANLALGLIRIKQRKFGEARAAFEKAIAGDPRNHIAYFRYAYLVSRESQDEYGFVRSFDPKAVVKMRDALKKAIAINPAFTESYELLAFVDLVDNDRLDEAASMMRTAMTYQPGNQRYALRLAEILSHVGKLDESEAIAKKISGTADEPDIRTRAAGLMSYITQKRAYERQVEAYKHRNNGAEQRRVEWGKPPSDEELARRQAEVNLRSLNAALRKAETGEQRVVGRIERVDCRSGPVVYAIKAGGEAFTLTSTDFESLTLNTFDHAAAKVQFACNVNVSAFNAVITYRATAPRTRVRGELVAVEFVPANFRLMNDKEMLGETVLVYQQPDSRGIKSTGPSDPADAAARRRAMMTQAINEALQKPAPGQKRELGFLDRIECSDNGSLFFLRTSTRTLKLLSTSPQGMKIVYYTPDLDGLELGCGSGAIEYPVVFVYSDKPDMQSRSDGAVFSLEFVPKSFTLE